MKKGSLLEMLEKKEIQRVAKISEVRNLTYLYTVNGDRRKMSIYPTFYIQVYMTGMTDVIRWKLISE